MTKKKVINGNFLLGFNLNKNKVYNPKKISLENFYFFNSNYQLWNKKLGLK